MTNREEMDLLYFMDAIKRFANNNIAQVQNIEPLSAAKAVAGNSHTIVEYINDMYKILAPYGTLDV